MTAVSEPALSTSLSYPGPHDPEHLAEGGGGVRSGQLLRWLSRGLFGYAGGEVEPVPDLAAGPPSVTEDGRGYRLSLRRGVYWDAQGAREVVAGDVVRGFKRLALPTAGHARRYFTATIAGLREYCDAYAGTFADHTPHVPDLAQFQFGREIPGVRAVDPYTVELTLLHPTRDLAHLLALGVVAAAPREFDYYLPDSPGLLRYSPSVGPYRVSRLRSQGRAIGLEPNPRWDPATDPLRVRTADTIHLAADEYGSVAELGEPVGFCPGPYLVVNVAGAHRTGSPLTDPSVRQALSLAVNRLAVRDALAGLHAVPQHGLVPPGHPAYGAVDPIVADSGDPTRAAEELARAGYPDGLTLTLRAGTDADRRVAAVLQGALARAGIRLVPADGAWDLAVRSHAPDWFGDNGRTSIDPIVRGGREPGWANLGGYDNPVVNRLLDYALRDPDLGRAADLWRKVESLVLGDLPVVPLVAHSSGACAAAAGAPPRVRWFE